MITPANLQATCGATRSRNVASYETTIAMSLYVSNIFP